MFNEATTASLGGGEVTEAPAKPKSREEKIADWKNQNAAAIQEARAACCTCTPTRAQMLLADQADGHAAPPID